MRRSSIRIRNVQLLFLFGFTISWFTGIGQAKSKILIDVIGSAFFDSKRHATANGDQGVYYELRIGKSLKKYLEGHISVGYQQRSFIYYAQENSVGLVPLYMDRHYVPVGVSGRIILSDFFFEKLGLWKKKGRFDVYYQLGVATLRGKDIPDEREGSFTAQGYYVPYYMVPYVQEYGKVYVTNLAGLRYNFTPSLGVFVEGGDGALMTLQLGLSGRF